MVEPGHEQAFLDRLRVERMWGVGPVTLDKLHRLGVTMVSDLRSVDESLLVAAVGPAQARHLTALALGHDDRAVEPDRTAKSIGHEETFAVDKFTSAELHRELVRLADGVAMRLRRAGVGARTITLKVRFAGFRTVTRSITSGDTVDLASDLVAAAAPMLREIDPTPGVRLLGLSGSNLGPPLRQLSFDELTAETDGSGDEEPTRHRRTGSRPPRRWMRSVSASAPPRSARRARWKAVGSASSGREPSNGGPTRGPAEVSIATSASKSAFKSATGQRCGIGARPGIRDADRNLEPVGWPR